MKVNQLLVRCYAERDGDKWFAVCIDFNLAAQANTAEEVKQDLESQILEYLYDALVGEDRAFAGQMLRRKAPLRYRAKYYLIKFGVMRVIETLSPRFKLGAKSSFESPISLTPNLGV